MSRVRVQIMNQFHRKSHEYKAIKRYWKLIQQDSRKLSDKHFYRPTFRMHLTNKEILNKLLSYSEDLKHHYQLYQLLLFHSRMLKSFLIAFTLYNILAVL
ncbi:IS1181 transposase [Streptococcus pneumoniae]|nr:IS1181 transposase [Streptococcus pneumoniae]